MIEASLRRIVRYCDHINKQDG